jgi:patatin-like phospholipase/acyl hydrolase
MAAVRILSIDGGGIRGVIPAVILSEVERRAGRPIHELFDLVVGTSTGGLIALALAAPAPGGGARAASDLVDLYEREGSNIFKRSLWKRLTSVGGFIDERYSADGLEDALDRYVGDTGLSAALTPVMVTSYDLHSRSAFFFRSSEAVAKPEYDFPMKVAARATSAAPTYFEPVHLHGLAADHESTYALVDGGVFANNPAMCGFVEARKSHPTADRFVVLSLGTGEQTRTIAYDEAKDWGLVEWARPMLNVVFDGVSDTVDFQLAQLLSGPAGPYPGSNYLRLQTELTIGNDDLDDATATNLAALKTLAGQIVAGRSAEIDRLIADLAP